MANADNLVKARQRILDIVKDAGDDGASLLQLECKSNMRFHGLLSHLGALIKQGSIRRHKSFNHYFYVGEQSLYFTNQKFPSTSAVDPSVGVKFSDEFTPYEEHLFNKFLDRLGLKVK